MDFEPVIIVVSREEVEACDIKPAMTTLRQLVASPDVARSYQEKVDITFHGYDNDRRELYEIPEVRSYVHKLDKEFPFWLFFLSKKFLDLHAIILCFMPPFLTEEAKARIFPLKIGELLEKWWFPALNHICAYAGIGEKEIENLTERTVKYISTGPLE